MQILHPSGTHDRSIQQISEGDCTCSEGDMVQTMLDKIYSKYTTLHSAVALYKCSLPVPGKRIETNLHDKDCFPLLKEGY